MGAFAAYVRAVHDVLACALAAAAIPSAVGTPVPVARGSVTVAQTPAEVNPLANRAWGVYKGSGDQAWTPYQRARGQKKSLSRRSRWAQGQVVRPVDPEEPDPAKVRDHIRTRKRAIPKRSCR